MKRALLFISLFIAGKSFSQCLSTIDISNNGGGTCNTSFPGNALHGSDNNYKKDGVVVVSFTSSIGAVVPEIATIREVTGNNKFGPYKNRRFVFKEFKNAAKTIAEYCVYNESGGDKNLFNGSKSKYQVVIQFGSNSGNQLTCIVEQAPPPSVLPVHFKSFTAERKNSSVVELKWVTASEQNNKGFYVQRNVGAEWKNIAFVFSAAETGNSSSDLTYQYKDPNSEKGITQYRIQQVDIDYKATYSDIRAIRGEGNAAKVSIYPNPSTTGKVNVVFENTTSVRDVIVSDIQGRIIEQYKSITSNLLVIEKLKAGFYTIKITDRTTAGFSVEKVLVK